MAGLPRVAGGPACGGAEERRLLCCHQSRAVHRSGTLPRLPARPRLPALAGCPRRLWMPAAARGCWQGAGRVLAGCCGARRQQGAGCRHTLSRGLWQGALRPRLWLPALCWDTPVPGEDSASALQPRPPPPPPHPQPRRGGASAMSRGSDGTLARAVLHGCPCRMPRMPASASAVSASTDVEFSRPPRSPLLQQAADAPRRPSVCRHRRPPVTESRAALGRPAVGGAESFRPRKQRDTFFLAEGGEERPFFPDPK